MGRCGQGGGTHPNQIPPEHSSALARQAEWGSNTATVELIHTYAYVNISVFRKKVGPIESFLYDKQEVTDSNP